MVDGDIARNYNKITKYWKFLDEGVDWILLNLIILLFSIKFYMQWLESVYILWWMFAIFGIIGSTKMTTIFATQFSINCVGWNETLESSIKTEKWDLISKIIYEFITPKSIFLWLFSNFRYYLLFWIIFGFMPLALVIYAIAINIRRIVLFITLWAYYKETHNNKIFHHFHKIECKNSNTIS
jgi:phosphatidylglycerophosphate synthase